MLEEKREPDAEGWWCRRDGLVHRGPTVRAPHVYLPDFFEMVLVGKLSRPGSRWYGPVIIPKDD